jgi:hypothetical protein
VNHIIKILLYKLDHVYKGGRTTGKRKLWGGISTMSNIHQESEASSFTDVLNVEDG